MGTYSLLYNVLYMIIQALPSYPGIPNQPVLVICVSKQSMQVTIAVARFTTMVKEQRQVIVGFEQRHFYSLTIRIAET